MRRSTKSRFDRRSRLGASAVEFALIAPLMMTFTFGMVELGRLMLVKQNATHATREGARVGVRPTADTAGVIQRVNDELALMGVTSANISVEPSSIEDADPGSLITVSVTIDIDDVSWIPGFFDFAASEITAESSMRRESTN